MSEKRQSETAAVAAVRVKVEVIESKRVTAMVDVDALIAAFPDEWADWMRGDEPSNDDKTEFVKETIYEMGLDFFAPGISPWADEVRDDDDLEVTLWP